MNRVFQIVSLAIVCGVSVGAANLNSPENVVEEFLAWEEKTQTSGIPDPDDAVELSSFLSKELMCLLASASAANDISERISPSDKPPFAEGNLFLPSAWDRPLAHVVLSVQQDGGQAQVKVRYQYEDDEAFIGKFILQKFGSAWRIVEIVRGGTCDFCQKGGLRTAMYAVLRSYPDAAAEACRSR